MSCEVQGPSLTLLCRASSTNCSTTTLLEIKRHQRGPPSCKLTEQRSSTVMTRRRRGSRSRPKSDACQRRLGVGRTSLRATSSGICEFGNICPVSDSYIIILRSFLIQTAVRIHPRTGETAFFNNVVSRFCHAVEAGTLDPPHINSKGAFQPPALVRPILV